MSNKYTEQILALKEKLNMMSEADIAEAAKYISDEEIQTFATLEAHIMKAPQPTPREETE